MKTLELRRHTLRAIPGQHLTQTGVNLARRLGNSMGLFDLVLTSNKTRAYETAIAMGFAVHEQHEELGEYVDAIANAIAAPFGFAQWVDAMKTNRDVARFVHAQSEFLRSQLDDLREGGSALVVSHSGNVEAGAIGCLPAFDWASAGDALSYCEGVRLSFDATLNQFVHAEVIRVK